MRLETHKNYNGYTGTYEVYEIGGGEHFISPNGVRKICLCGSYIVNRTTKAIEVALPEPDYNEGCRRGTV